MQRTPESAFAQVGRRVRSAREAAGLTQEDVAHASGINLSYCGKLERGRNNPTLDTLIRVADAVGVDPGTLVENLTPAVLPERRPGTRRGPRRTSAA